MNNKESEETDMYKFLKGLLYFKDKLFISNWTKELSNQPRKAQEIGFSRLVISYSLWLIDYDY